MPDPACSTSRFLNGCHWLRQCSSASLLLIALAAFVGCPRTDQSQPNQQPKPSDASPATRASVTLRVLVVNDPPLVEAINRLRGEWAERSGGELNAMPAKWDDLAQSKTIDADLIVFPSRYLGDLCSRKLLRPVRASVMEDEDFKSADIFPLVRNELIKWKRETFALPLGIDPSAISLSVDSSPAIALLASAAPRAISNERIGVLFDTDMMTPRITEPPFVDALAQLVETHGPQATKATSAKTEKPAIPVLGDNDRLAAVTSSSRNAASAFKLLAWLAQPDTESQFARVGGQWLPPRRSIATTSAWYDPSLSATQRAEQGKLVDVVLSGERSLVIPRIPDIDDYLAALDDAVKSALSDKMPPAAALQTAAQRWEQITDRMGRDKQRAAYLAHLGIE
jgi:hypothetical protein